MYNIMERLIALRKKGKKVYAVDVIKELEKVQIHTNSAEFSRFANGIEERPKSETVLEASDKIISEWEAQYDT